MLVVDECVSAWKGRKGTELNSLADGDSGVLLGLELVEGAVRQRQMAHFSELGEGTAVVLRLVE
ncbi:hypothetical protein L914_16788 [Phytophthora nicotianae]|uniref:Uncharacterized protein n=1 Tax=Phytophthora nicotianae TaxID=4792 RepID=W2MJL6_PHYNI|nr:hypothetical protein L914_16788 [Phytophthora nicotianae]